MIVNNLKQNVFDASMMRLEYIFNEFDNVYVSFSGGKDSGILLNLVLFYIKNYAKNRTFGVFHMDYEVQYTETTKYIDRVYSNLNENIEKLRVCVPFKVTTATSMFQTFWRPWEEDKNNLWVRDMPDVCLKENDFNFITSETSDYEFQEKFSEWYHEKKKAKKSCVLVGIRSQESLDRWRTIVSDRNINKYNNRPWTTKVNKNIYNAYPIYDWTTEDIWTANYKFNWDYNKIYDLFYYAGVPLNAMRVASPFLGTAKSSLNLYRAIDPDVWGKMISRVNGVNFTAMYGSTKAMGWNKIEKPNHFTWRQYAMFLLDTLPDKTANEFKKKLYADDIKSKDFRLIPTWKRLCVCILKNDHIGKYMGFGLNKFEMEKRKSAIEKYRNL